VQQRPPFFFNIPSHAKTLTQATPVGPSLTCVLERSVRVLPTTTSAYALLESLVVGSCVHSTKLTDGLSRARSTTAMLAADCGTPAALRDLVAARENRLAHTPVTAAESCGFCCRGGGGDS